MDGECLLGVFFMIISTGLLGFLFLNIWRHLHEPYTDRKVTYYDLNKEDQEKWSKNYDKEREEIDRLYYEIRDREYDQECLLIKKSYMNGGILTDYKGYMKEIWRVDSADYYDVKRRHKEVAQLMAKNKRRQES